jgi:hypothetical protein
MTLSERNQQILDRLGRLNEVAEPIKSIFVEGKREQLMAGVSAQGAPFAPLAPSTLRRREGSGAPLVPHGSGSRLITGYVVSVEARRGELAVGASWPGLPWVQYHRTGTRKMPKRDPGGFREQDKAKAVATIVEFIFRG